MWPAVNLTDNQRKKPQIAGSELMQRPLAGVHNTAGGRVSNAQYIKYKPTAVG